MDLYSFVLKGSDSCYLQTELGHGSNVAALETTATYIPETQEFEINSPTLTSRKWWIGALGRTATHGVVQAQLILPEVGLVGPHLFFIQLRSTGKHPVIESQDMVTDFIVYFLANHAVLPGITLGEIGKFD